MLTDDGSQVTDCFATEDKKPSGKHAFDEATPRSPSNVAWYCRHPQTDGMVERLDGRINELLQQTRFDSKADLEATLMNYLSRTTATSAKCARRKNAYPGPQGMAEAAHRMIN
ncbi:hypothetical protein ACL58G_31110 [Massilia sp. GER05]|uniref:hypothetical protein n=1 Tax=Massilia sp. CT11-137 TaxID=3393901 RepID=UPI0039B09938